MTVSNSPWHTPSERRNANNYEAGRRAYLDGARYNFHANMHWQRGFRDARDSAAGIDRHRNRDRSADPVGGGTDGCERVVKR